MAEASKLAREPTRKSGDDDQEPLRRVLDEPFVFTQRPALTVRAFCDELKRRKIDLFPNANELEAFHRAGLVVPIYSIEYNPRAIRSRANLDGRHITQAEVRRALDATSTYGHDLIGEREIGDLRLPAADGYASWRTQRRSFAGRPYQTQQFLYSHYQLLLAPMLAQLWPQLRGRLGKAQRLRLSDFSLKHHRATAAGIERLVPMLTVLEAVYLPDIVENVSLPGFHDDFEAWDRFRATFDAPAALGRLRWSAEEVLNTAEGLIFRGRTIDPAATLHELLRLVHPSHWKRLEGDSLIAMDYRIAAELFLLFYEDLAKAGAAKPLDLGDARNGHTQRHRLRTDRTELDATLTRFGLSPHRAVVVILEGKTEQTIAPLVLDRLYKPSWRNHVRLFDVQGVNQNLDSLAAFVAVPAVTESERDVVTLAYHPTRFVVLSDAEGPNASAHSRDQRRSRWVDRIYDALPSDIRDEIERSELDSLFQIFVWDEDGNDFERAHFSDEELAEGISAIAQHGPPRQELLGRLAQSRANKTGLKNVWRDWPAPPTPQKPRLALELWPLLRTKIDAAIKANSLGDVPVAKRLVEVMDLARKYPRHYSVVMQRRESEDEAETAR